MPLQWTDIERDNRFKAMPYGDKVKMATSYFDNNFSLDPRFGKMSRGEQRDMRERFMMRLGPDPAPSGFDSFVNSFMAVPGSMMASYQELFGYAEEADRTRQETAFEYPATGNAALAGSALASAIPSAAALAGGIMFPPAAIPLSYGVLTAYGLSSAGEARKIVREYETETGEDVSDGTEIALALGFGASAFAMEKLGMVAGNYVLKKQAPTLFKRVGDRLIAKNIPEAAKIIGAMAVEEGAEEGAEQFVQNSLTQILVNPDQGLLEGVREAGLGGLLGGGFGSFPLLPKRVRRMARDVKGVEEGEAPDELRNLPPSSDKQNPIVIKAEATNIQLAREAMMLAADPSKARTFSEARNWQAVSRLAAGDDPKAMTGTQPLGVSNTAEIVRGNLPTLPDASRQELDFNKALYTNELIETAYEATAFAKQDVERVSAIGQVPNAEMAALELSESELIFAWNQANPEDTDSEGLKAYIASREEQGPPTKRASAGAKWTKIWEKSQPGWTKGIRPAEGRADRATQRDAEQEKATLSKAEIRKQRRQQKREEAELAKRAPKPGTVAALEEQIKARKENRLLDIGDRFIGQPREFSDEVKAEGDRILALDEVEAIKAFKELPDTMLADVAAYITTDTSVHTLNRGEGMAEEQNTISTASAKDKAEPTAIQRQRLALPLQTSGIIGRVVQTPGQLYHPGTSQPANAVLDRATGTVYLSADVEFNTIGHEGFHRLLDLLGRDTPIAKEMLAFYQDKEKPEEELSDAVGQYYADRIQAGPAKRVGGWMKDMWVAAKDAVGVEMTQEELIQAANIHLKSAPNGRGQSGYLSQIFAYHGSGAIYDEMDLQYLMSGEGSLAFGAGFYFTNIRSIAELYAKIAGSDSSFTDIELTLNIGGKDTHFLDLPFYKHSVDLQDASASLADKEITLKQFVGIIHKVAASQEAKLQETITEGRKVLKSRDDKAAQRILDRALEAHKDLREYIELKESDFTLVYFQGGGRHIYTAFLRKGQDPANYDIPDWYAPPTERQLGKIKRAFEGALAQTYTAKPLDDGGAAVYGADGRLVRETNTLAEAQEVVQSLIRRRMARFVVDKELILDNMEIDYDIKFEKGKFVIYDSGENRLGDFLSMEEARQALRDSLEDVAEMEAKMAEEELALRDYSSYYWDLKDIFRSNDPALGKNKARVLASRALWAEGIDGTKYPPNTLRGNTVRGSVIKDANYVVYDPSIVTIEDRYSFQDKKAKEYAGNVNLTRINLDKAMEQLIQDELSKKADPTVMTREDLESRSTEILRKKGFPGMEALVQRFLETGQISLEEADALDTYSASGYVNALDQWAMGEEPDIAKVLKEQADHDFEVASMLSKDAGRRLEARKRMRDPYLLWEHLRNLETELSEEDAAYLSQIVKDGSINDPQTARDMYNRLQKPKAKDYFFEYFYNSILSGIPTHFVNVGNNALWLAFQLPHRALQAAVDKTLTSELVHSIFPSLHQESRNIFLDEVVPMWKGIKNRANKTYRYLVDKKGMDPDTFDRQATKWRREMGQSFEAFERSPHAWMRALAPYISRPAKALEAQDMFFHALAFDAQLNALIVREAKKTGKSFKEVIANPPENIIADAAQFGEYATFMDAPGTLATNIIRLRDKVPFGVGRLIVPFVNTLTNILKRGVEITPGVGYLASRNNIKEGKAEASDVITKQVEGLILAMATTLAFGDPDDEGDFPITGAVPQRQAERDAFYRQGKIPYAVKINGTWISYRKFEPFALPLAITANIMEATKREDVKESELMEYVSTLGNVMMRTVISSTYTENVSRLMDDKGIQRVVERLPSSMVPYSSFFRSFNRAAEAITEGDATLREAKGFTAALANTIPFSEYIIDDEGKARLNNFGEEIRLPGGAMRQWLPFKWSDSTDDPTEQELERLGVYPGLPSKEITISGEKHELSDELWREYALLYGARTKEAISLALGGRGYARLSDVQKIKFIDRTIRRLRGSVTKQVKQVYLRQNPQGRR